MEGVPSTETVKTRYLSKSFNWIKGFLCQRSFRVRYGSSLSKSKILKTGPHKMLFQKVNAVKSIETKLSAALNVLGVWCDANNMEVNLNKSYCLTFSLMHRTLDLQPKYKSIQIPLCDNFKYLGVTFDRKLTWKHHVEDISNRAMKRLSALKRLAGAR
ncbi:hypothetical protein CEXT_214591 [Caerostris extrusa]|uniref:Reverse transcriptase n=1 Tax=Caerostris extrusa TaxID=172846 RepID=A0AAV4M8X2_CAEEX|nr:hypothetical protein CEXT_214591 [Caerostris extrusa]